MSNLARNLQLAEGASNYARGILNRGSNNVPRSNPADALFGSGLIAHHCVTQLRGSYPDSINFGDHDDDWIDNVASRATSVRCGNCAEHVAVALTWLFKQSPPPSAVDFMGFNPTLMPANSDHMFLVIGRARNSYPLDISTWGPDAAICDPWEPEFNDPTIKASWASRRAYPASAAMSRMYPFLPRGINALQRLASWGT